MSRYLVRCSVNTPSCILPIADYANTKNQLQYEFRYLAEVVRVSVRDEYEVERNLPHHLGLIADVECDAEGVESAEIKGIDYADMIFTWISLVTASFVGVPKRGFVYDITSGVSERDFALRIPMKYSDRVVERVIPPVQMDQIFQAYCKPRPEEEPPQRQARVSEILARASMWMRKGFGENSVIDGFLFFWTALEALDELLPKGRRALPPECPACHFAIQKCPECGKTLPMQASASPLFGVEALFKRNDSAADFPRLKTLRNKIVHGEKRLSGSGGLIEQARKDIEVARRMAIAGLQEAYATQGLPEEWASVIQGLESISESYEKQTPLRGRVTGIKEFDSDGDRIAPEVEITDSPTSVGTGNLLIKRKNFRWVGTPELGA